MRYLLLAIALVPLLPTPVSAQSWQDWAKQNPTYPVPKPQAPLPQATPPAAPAPSVTEPKPQPVLSTQNPELVNHLMQDCLDKHGAKQQAFCACGIQKMQNHFTFQQLLKISEEYQRTGVYPQEFTEKIDRPCAFYLVR